jgi:hypothetical protein
MSLSLCHVEGGIIAEFTGGRGEAAPLTWGQRGIWDAMHRNPTSRFNLIYDVALPPDGVGATAVLTQTAVADAVARVVSRHEALRTQIREVAGEPRQYVAPAGRLLLRLVDCDPSAVARTVQELRSTSYQRDFAHDTELPLRICVVAAGGALRRMVFCFNHLTVDEGAAQIVMADVQALLRSGTFASLPAPQPLDLAREEQDSGRPVTQRAVRYWREQLRRVPPTMFRPFGPAHDPRSQSAALHSPALNAAARGLAARHGVSPTNILLAATATMIGAWTGHRTSVLSVIVNNRFRPRYRYVVDNLQKLGLFALDLDDSLTFDEIVPLAWAAALQTYRYAYYDQRALDAASAQVRAERGVEVNPFSCFNGTGNIAEVAPAAPLATGPPLDSGPSLAAGQPGESTLRWVPNPSQVRCRFCLRVVGTGANQRVRLRADTAYLPPAHIERFLYGLESLVVEAVAGGPSLGELRGRFGNAQTRSWTRLPARAGGPGQDPSMAAREA